MVGVGAESNAYLYRWAEAEKEGRPDMVSPSPFSTLNSSDSTSDMQIIGLHLQDLKVTHRPSDRTLAPPTSVSAAPTVLT